MVFRLRVTLTGIKGFFRIYHVNGATTLYTLHKQMRADMEFPQDQLIMFKALDVEGAVVGRYGLFDLGSGTVDQVSLEKAVKAGATDFVYFYDVTNRKSVNIAVEGEVEKAVVSWKRPSSAPTPPSSRSPRAPTPSNSRTATSPTRTCPTSSATCPARTRAAWTSAMTTKTSTTRTRRKRRRTTTRTARKSTTRTNSGWAGGSW